MQATIFIWNMSIHDFGCPESMYISPLDSKQKETKDQVFGELWL